jgi:hypothetical protein
MPVRQGLLCRPDISYQTKNGSIEKFTIWLVLMSLLADTWHIDCSDYPHGSPFFIFPGRRLRPAAGRIGRR